MNVVQKARHDRQVEIFFAHLVDQMANREYTEFFPAESGSQAEIDSRARKSSPGALCARGPAEHGY
jgi:hypothetical protein